MAARAALAAAWLALAAAMQFDLAPATTKCLQEPMSKHDLGKGGFKVLGLEPGAAGAPPPPSGVAVAIVGPNGEPEYSRDDAPEGKFAFTAGEGGMHRACFTNHAPVPRRVAFDFAAGANAKDYSEVAKNEHLRPIELELRKLEDRVEGIHKEMLFQREREEAHRNTNESTNARVMWFSLASIAVVLVMAVFQVFTLHSFFRKKKFL